MLKTETLQERLKVLYAERDRQAAAVDSRASAGKKIRHLEYRIDIVEALIAEREERQRRDEAAL